MISLTDHQVLEVLRYGLIDYFINKSTAIFISKEFHNLMVSNRSLYNQLVDQFTIYTCFLLKDVSASKPLVQNIRIDDN